VPGSLLGAAHQTAVKATSRRESLAARNAAHEPRYWMLLTPHEAHELAEGRLPDQVQRMAQWLDEDRPRLGDPDA
jgi:hypothetical protein